MMFSPITKDKGATGKGWETGKHQVKSSRGIDDVQPILLNERSDASQAEARRTQSRESRMQPLSETGETTLRGEENRKNHSHVAHLVRPHSTASIPCGLCGNYSCCALQPYCYS
jgi:uncharacterized ferredoxin-like protein